MALAAPALALNNGPVFIGAQQILASVLGMIFEMFSGRQSVSSGQEADGPKCVCLAQGIQLSLIPYCKLHTHY
jgi:hypothetical protein